MWGETAKCPEHLSLRILSPKELFALAKCMWSLFIPCSIEPQTVVMVMLVVFIPDDTVGKDTKRDLLC